MEFRHLRYFLVLAEELHFGRAARRLNISQPPLSFNIKQLEASLGVELFSRNSHGVRLTPAGEAFRQSAQRVLAEAGAAALQVREVAAGVTSRVRIGFVGSMLFRGMPERLGEFQAAHPQVQVELTELNSAEQLEALARIVDDFRHVLSQRWARVILASVFLEALTLYGPFAFIPAHLHERFGVEDDHAEAVLRLEPVDQLVQRRTHRLDGAALHGAGAVDHRDEGLPRPVGDLLGHRGGEGDQAGHLILGLQGDDVDIELCGELHGGPPPARAPARTSPLSQRGLTVRGCR